MITDPDWFLRQSLSWYPKAAHRGFSGHLFCGNSKCIVFLTNPKFTPSAEKLCCLKQWLDLVGRFLPIPIITSRPSYPNQQEPLWICYRMRKTWHVLNKNILHHCFSQQHHPFAVVLACTSIGETPSYLVGCVDCGDIAEGCVKAL